ncbi:MAG: hypothetical protein NTV58_16500 [Deltaproteobacteria bacterium]|nr:hypothetical protein [Deltaproteobacteria bacterium]
MKTYPLRNLDFYINSFTLFTVLFLFHLLWIFQGIDVTDNGFHLTNQVLAFSGHGDKTLIMIFLSDYIGGAWLSLAGSPNLIWARLGGVLIFCLTAQISYHMLSTLFDKKRVFYIVIISTILITMTIPTFIIDYYSFPALLMNIGLFFVYQLWNSENDPKKSNIYSFLVGFIAVPIILSRFPLIMIFLIPFIVVVSYRLTKQSIAALSNIAKYSLLGFAIALVIFTAFYHSLGLLSRFIEEIAKMFSRFAGGGNIPNHDIPQFQAARSQYDVTWYLAILYGDGLFLTACTAIILPVLYIVSRIKKKLSFIGLSLTAYLAVLITLGAILLFCRYVFNLHIDLVVAVLVSIILMVAASYFSQAGKVNTRTGILLLLGLSIMLINPLGSSAGYLCRTIYGMWLVLPLALLLTYDLIGKLKEGNLKRMLSLNTAIILLLIPIALFAHYRNIYRDDLNRARLNTPFQDKALQLVFSHRERVDAVDDALRQIRLRTEKGDKTLMVGGIYLFYYLTETRPVWPTVWMGLTSLLEFDDLIAGLSAGKEYPKVVVFSKVNMRENNWPEVGVRRNVGMAKDYFREIDYLKISFREKLDYRIVWENRAFEIYARR